jgi:lipid II:glycine glycyltransferase (peptidoglycan interpeptide bridge formation enzyme)
MEFLSREQYHVQFLQSWHWKEFQEKIGRRTFVLAVEDRERIIGYALFIIHRLPFGQYFYCPRGPLFVKDITEEAQAQAIGLIVQRAKELAAKTRTIFFRIEPPMTQPKKPWIEGVWWQSRLSWKRTRFVQPSDTLLLNLNQEEGVLMDEMRPKTRYNIKLARRKGVMVAEGKGKGDFEIFWMLLSETAKRQNIRTHSREYYEQLLSAGDDTIMECQLFIASYDEVPLSAIMMLYYYDTAIYLHGGTSHLHRNVMAPHFLQWQSILSAKKRGCHYYDFYGIAPKDGLNHPLANVGRFKRGFGGREVNYVGTYDLIFHSRWYKLYRILKNIQKFMGM